jgi:hypothetical protein
MADNEERQPGSGREGTPSGDELDQTRAFDPLADDQPPGGPAQRLGPGDTARQPAADETNRLVGPDDAARFSPGMGGAPDDAARFSAGMGGDDTARFPPGAGGDEDARTAPGAVPPDRTARMPPIGPGPQPGEPAAWSGRARVPPPGPPLRDSAPAEWGPVDEAPGRTWWLPILIGVVALLLLAVLAFGFWLIANTRDEEGPVTPSPSPSAVAPTPTLPTPTSAAPTTESPSPGATTAESVTVPQVVDLPLPVAQRMLERLGLRYQVEYRESDRPARTVLDSNPEQGAEVAPGSEVRLIVAEPREEEPPTTPPATQTPSPTIG